MFIFRRSYKTKIKQDFHPKSTVKIFRSGKIVNNNHSSVKKASNHNSIESTSADSTSARQHVYDSVENDIVTNAFNVQMIPRNLHKQIFGIVTEKVVVKENKPNLMSVKECLNELRKAGLDLKGVEQAHVELKLPPLRGNNIVTHIHEIAKEQVAPYQKLLGDLMHCKHLPQRPREWSKHYGWTKYDGQGRAIAVNYPEDDALVLDVEVCVKIGAMPVLATAVSEKHWYSWVSANLFKSDTENVAHHGSRYALNDLIPLGNKSPKIIVGHNVSYDRARLLEQYLLEDSGIKFLDTMSMHVCVSGITSYQRAMMKSKQDSSPEDNQWKSQTSLNSLVEVHRLYCGGPELAKDARNIFLEGTYFEIQQQFQSLMAYCASDVEATHRVLTVLYPLFCERFTHPATLAGMLELSTPYLPVNSNWLRYLKESDLAYEELQIEAKSHLIKRADEACSLLHNNEYRNNLWLFDEDWSTQELKLKKAKAVKDKGTAIASPPASTEESKLRRKFQYLYDTKALLPVRRPLLPGYPGWYRKLCKKHSSECVWSPGAMEISTSMQIAPKLLSLCWEGYPLYYLKDYGWGFLVPFRRNHPTGTAHSRVPIERLSAFCPVLELDRQSASESEVDYAFDHLENELNIALPKPEFFAKLCKDHTDGQYKGSGVWCNKVLEQCCYFLKLPHKNGKSFRVGNPLSRDFLNKFAENVLTSGDSESSLASRIIEIARMMSYWRNNRDRIIGQIVVWLPQDYIKSKFQIADDAYDNAVDYGAILPQVVVCGTLTRRAMEPTWLTASNSKTERIGSELRALVQAPPTYKLIGADVDSQELWIASMLGDASACRMHGGTPLGWMTLSGTKSNGTDMHSVTAKAVGISRDHAKVINYARIYGAGQNFAEGLLKQFNPTFSAAEAKSKAKKMFEITKGNRSLRIRNEYLGTYDDKAYSLYEAKKIALTLNRSLGEVFTRPTWKGGTESAMFNRLEEIATSDTPVTPFLKCRLSRALEPSTVSDDNRFLPTRVNWVVQSGAVDFLHVMLVCMRWLMGPHVRFSLSFHDELRYLVKEDMQYKAALAMHVTNLLTRSFCSASVGLNDLPMSVAFFSSVEVDKVLRKECTMDCVSPSNPYGLSFGYGIPPGESLTINNAIKKAGTNDLSQWDWIK